MSNWIILLVKFPRGTKYALVSGPATFTAVLDNELLGEDQEKTPIRWNPRLELRTGTD